MKQQEAKKPGNDEAKKPGNDKEQEKKEQDKSEKEQHKNDKKNKQTSTAQDAQQHERNNDGAPVHPSDEHKIKGWVEAQPNYQDQKTN